MATGFQFEHQIPFEPSQAAEILRHIPTLPGIFALRGESAAGKPPAEPYLTRAADLRRRMTRLLNPPPGPEGQPQAKRLNLRDRVRSIEYSVTGSEFESLLQLYDASSALFTPAEARRRLRLHTPYFLRLTIEHAHPRVYSTNRLSKRGLAQTYGPFPSRTSAERYCDAVLDLFKLRRCYEDLEVHPSHPGCAYGEMKKCMAPCNTTCTAGEYAAEAQAVQAFFDTHGESMLTGISAERERASAEMEFERAADLHEQFTKVKAAASLAGDLVRPVQKLRAIIVQPAAKIAGEPAHEADHDASQPASIFLLEGGCILGPERLSTLGVRAVKEQTSVGSSLFAQPLMLQAVPLEDATTPLTPTESPELRAEHVLALLATKTGATIDLATMSDHLSLLRRWYYRPEKQRTGEVFFPNTDSTWPIRRILRGAARMALGEPKAIADTQRDEAASAKVRILHEGREGIERTVPALARPKRSRKVRAEVIVQP